ncbi:MAG: glucosamine-6-phosphate deaminase [Segetibacter sp.]|nr:glucosamine-6-phosphate deaminase [Segetibacter sp.]
MKLYVADTNEEMSKKVLEDILQLTQDYKNPLICPASGDTPAALYKALTEFMHKTNAVISDWYFVGLDEWAGMNGNDEGSCRYYLDRQLFEPLEVADQNICFFDGRSNELQLECEKVEEFIKQHDGIDVAIVGLGMNGHVGMNEPGTSPELRSHVADIDPVTQQVGQKYFKEKKQITQGITLGIATIMEADNIILMVSGSHKAEIVQKVLEGEISNELPASLLRNHPGLRVYLDKDAASKIQPS